MKDISLKVVILSSIFSFGLMLLLIIILGGLFAKLHAGAGSPDEIAKAFQNSWMAYLALVAPIVAGYLAALSAKQRALLHGALSASLNVLWGIFCLFFLGPLPPAGILLLVANPFLGMLGGYLYLKAYSG